MFLYCGVKYMRVPFQSYLARSLVWALHMRPISILVLSYNVLQWTVMTTAFLRVSKLKYFLWALIKYFR